jgi:hypothetical protein
MRNFTPLINKAIYRLPARARVTIEHMRFHHRWPDFDNPETFNEKVTWRKLYDQYPCITFPIEAGSHRELLGD